MAASELAQRLHSALQTRVWKKSKAIGVAVSGGGDSMALLAAVSACRLEDGALKAATVNHGLRPEAAQEAQTVATYCAAHGIPHETLSVDVPQGSGLQARARDARYGALREWARQSGIATVLVGHTADDVAETLLMRLKRGTGIDGLAQMPDQWRDDEGQDWARPLLDFSRPDLRSYLEEQGVSWIEDPSNDDPTFERVRLRQQMATLGFEVVPLARSARSLAEAAQSLEARTSSLVNEVTRTAFGDVLFNWPRLETLLNREPEQARRLLLAALSWIGGTGPRGEEITDLMQSLRQGVMKRTLCGCLITKSIDEIRIGREVAACEQPAPVDDIWDGRWRVTPPEDGDTQTRGDLWVGALDKDLPKNLTSKDLPRDTLRASPAVRTSGGTLIAAPLAGIGQGWAAQTLPNFPKSIQSRRSVSR